MTVTKKGRPAAVMLPVEDYARIRGAPRRRLLATVTQAQADAAAARGGLPDNRDWDEIGGADEG